MLCGRSLNCKHCAEGKSELQRQNTAARVKGQICFAYQTLACMRLVYTEILLWREQAFQIQEALCQIPCVFVQL